MNKKIIKKLVVICLIIIPIIVCTLVFAAPQDDLPLIPKILQPAETREDVNTSIQILFLLTILSLAPAILIMMTSFTRIIIILSFLRNALGTQQMPPNQVLVGFALFLTFFIMAPVGTEINQQAIQPYLAEEITQQEAFGNALKPLRGFMIKQTRKSDMNLFLNLSETKYDKNVQMEEDDIPTTVVIPSFVISELKTAFQFGFLIYIPFLIVDMVVASTLMSMGMMMLPPIMISLPFKILLFIMVDGWNLLTQSIVTSFK